jgi:protocatechuate 3,4-dioxygenase beta subunit
MQEPLMPADNSTCAARRRALGALGSIGVLALAGCGGGGGSSSSDSSATTSTTGTSSAATTTTATAASASTTTASSSSSQSCAVVPEETAGPYPADGSNASSNTYNVLALSGIVRSDIRTNIGGSAQVGGVPLTLKITLTSTNNNCAALAGYAIYLWHCTREGTYSVYTTQSLSDNHLRGVQETDSGGSVTFVTVVPGCYSGRMPHMHLEVYPSLGKATAAANKIKTTQLALPTETLRTVYATSGYSQSISNLDASSFATDNVFSDGTTLEMVTMTGNTTDGYAANITISIAA